MQYTVNQLYQHLFEKPLTIYDIFKGFFGEDFVDMQYEMGDEKKVKSYLFARISDEIVEENFDTPYEVNEESLKNIENTYKDRRFILYVWWPRVTVTNEYDKSVNIKDLYAKIEIENDGCIPYECSGFLLNRATYTREQFVSDYMFSHINGIPKDNFSKFLSPCLGSGPIRETINTLKNEYDETTWMLFCQELSMYVTVESIAGGPWRKMEVIGNKSLNSEYIDYTFDNADKNYFISVFTNENLKNFIQYYLKHGHLSLRYVNRRFTCGMLYYEYIIDISNTFIDYYNKYLKSTAKKLEDCFTYKLLKSVIVANGKFYTEGRSDINASSLNIYQNKPVLTFKGKEIRTEITDIDYGSSEVSYTTVIAHNLAMYILQRILRTINFRYQNEHNSKSKRNQGITSACERIFYL